MTPIAQPPVNVPGAAKVLGISEDEVRLLMEARILVPLAEPPVVPQPPALLRAVPFDFLAANQAIAALEDRLSWLRLHEDTASEAAAAHRAVVALREAFGLADRACLHPEDSMTSNEDVILCTRCRQTWTNKPDPRATTAHEHQWQPHFSPPSLRPDFDWCVRCGYTRPLMTEAALDAAHEASVAEFAELADAEGLPDVPLAENMQRAMAGDR